MLDKSYRGRISEQIDPTEIGLSKKVIARKNTEKAWQYKEYPEYHQNFIVISKDGTLGDIMKVGELYIGLPSKRGKEVINKNVRPRDAKWKREEPPKEFKELWYWYKDVMSGATERDKKKFRRQFVQKRDALIRKYHEFVESEFHKREYGVFIKIDAEVLYLTGENWMFLKHYYLSEDDMYPKFRVVQTEAYWHWEAVKADTRVWGEIRGKGRRTAWSVESASMALNQFSITRYARIPIVSERDDLAKEFLQDKITPSFEYYPIYFKPLIMLPNKEQIGALKIVHETPERPKSIISVYPTKITAYDSKKVKYLSINDEVGKWLNTSLSEFISRHSKAHEKGNGKARFGSTAGDYEKGGGKEFEKEFNYADANNRTKTGRTTNGLINFFIDVCYTKTLPKSFFDEWGYSIVFDPKEPILNEDGILIEYGAITDWEAEFDNLKSKNDIKKLNAFLRDMPRTIEHMFRQEGGTNNDFNTYNLNTHYDYLNRLDEYEIAKHLFRGDLHWRGKPYESDVYWKPNPQGRFKTSWIPDRELQNKAHNINFHGTTVKAPSNNEIGVFGIDPYDLMGNTKDGRGSFGTIVGYSKASYASVNPYSFFLTYRNRPKKRDDFYDDVIKAVQFFGFYALIESNKSRLLEYMYDKGYTGYVLRRPDKKWKNLSDQEKKLGGIPASSLRLIGDQIALLQDYIDEFVGVNVEDDCKVYDKDLIVDWLNFKPRNREKYDLTVASKLALFGATYRVKARNHVPKQKISNISLNYFSA